MGRVGGGSEGFFCYGLWLWLDLKCMLVMGLGYLGYLSGSWGLIVLYFDFVFIFFDMVVFLFVMLWLFWFGIFFWVKMGGEKKGNNWYWLLGVLCYGYGCK